MTRKTKKKRSAGQRSAFHVSKMFHSMAGVAGVCEEINGRANGLLTELGDKVELLAGIASVVDRGESVEKKADEAAKAACDSAFGKDPEADKAEGENGEGAQAPA